MTLCNEKSIKILRVHSSFNKNYQDDKNITMDILLVNGITALQLKILAACQDNGR